MERVYNGLREEVDPAQRRYSRAGGGRDSRFRPAAGFRSRFVDANPRDGSEDARAPALGLLRYATGGAGAGSSLRSPLHVGSAFASDGNGGARRSGAGRFFAAARGALDARHARGGRQGASGGGHAGFPREGSAVGGGDALRLRAGLHDGAAHARRAVAFPAPFLVDLRGDGDAHVLAQADPERRRAGDGGGLCRRLRGSARDALPRQFAARQAAQRTARQAGRARFADGAAGALLRFDGAEGADAPRLRSRQHRDEAFR